MFCNLNFEMLAALAIYILLHWLLFVLSSRLVPYRDPESLLERPAMAAHITSSRLQMLYFNTPLGSEGFQQRTRMTQATT